MRARITSSQASHATTPARAHPLNINSDRRKKHSTTRKTDQAIGWVKRPISSLINEKARLWKVSRSQAIARLIEMGMANDLFQAHEQIITDAVSRAVAREHQIDRARTMNILYRIYVRVSQLLYLTINLLGRVGSQKQVTAGQLDRIIAWSRQQAREDVVRRSPKTEALGDAITAWLADDGMRNTGEEGEEGRATAPKSN